VILTGRSPTGLCSNVVRSPQRSSCHPPDQQMPTQVQSSRTLPSGALCCCSQPCIPSTEIRENSSSPACHEGNAWGAHDSEMRGRILTASDEHRLHTPSHVTGHLRYCSFSICHSRPEVATYSTRQGLLKYSLAYPSRIEESRVNSLPQEERLWWKA